MEFLSLQEPGEEPVVKVSRSEAVLLSVGVHLCLVLLFLLGPALAIRVLPKPILALLSQRPPPALATTPPVAPTTTQPKQPERDKIPLKFAYVSVPNDIATEKNPNARLQSDKNRKARQEVPTPRDARKFSTDPHSEGTSIDRVKPDPSRPEGREDVEARQRAARGSPSTEGRGATTGAKGGNQKAQEASAQGPGGMQHPREVPEAGAGEAETKGEGGTAGQRGVLDGTGEPGAETRENLKQALSDLKSGEYKFQFNNPSYLRDGAYGTMSFDTQDFPWGDYARKIYLIIRNNWYQRIPLAAREGIRGWVCQRFVIEKDGTISSVRAVRPSGVAPFDKSSADALEASSRLPPLPPDFPEANEGVTFCFYYNTVPGEESD
ncbi:MAG TPA: energy transducer TonB [Candidatus Polarisedimenticolia bacterium]|nr:energy transducer TonB [Candidatus Polarisedimenticolia bacterium]